MKANVAKKACSITNCSYYITFVLPSVLDRCYLTIVKIKRKLSDILNADNMV